MRFTNRFDTALVSCVFFRPGLWRLEKSAPHPRQGKWDKWKSQCYANKNDDKQERARGHFHSALRSICPQGGYSLDFLPNHRRFFGLGSSVGAGSSTGFSSFAVGSSFSAGSSAFGSERSGSARSGFGSAFFGFAFFSSAGSASTISAISTHSMKAIGAESLLRWPSLTIRV